MKKFATFPIGMMGLRFGWKDVGRFVLRTGADRVCCCGRNQENVKMLLAYTSTDFASYASIDIPLSRLIAAAGLVVGRGAVALKSAAMVVNSSTTPVARCSLFRALRLTHDIGMMDHEDQ